MTARNEQTGAVTFRCRNNATDATSFAVEACAGYDRYDCYRQIGLDLSDPWARVGTAQAVARYADTSFTFTPPTTCSGSPGNKPGSGSHPCDGVLYSLRMKAVNSAGESTFSAAVQNTPGQPSDVTAQSSGGNVTLHWVLNKPRIETGVIVERCDGTANQGSCLNDGGHDNAWQQPRSGGCSGVLPQGTTSCTESGLSPSVYVYRVQAIDGAGATEPWGGDVGYVEPYGGNTLAATVTLH